MCSYDFLAEQLLEVFCQHRGRTSFNDGANLRCEADGPQARKASHAREHDVDNEPFDVIVCSSGHSEVSYEPWVASSPLQRIEWAGRLWHERELRALDLESPKTTLPNAN